MGGFKNKFINSRYNYLLTFTVSIVLSIAISIILLYDKSITSTGAVIISIFGGLFLTTFLLVIELKFKLDDLMYKKNISDEILENYAESTMLRDKFISVLSEDLKFDKTIKTNKKSIEDPHLILSKIKIENYFKDFFVFSSDKKTICDIPSFYFIENIWPKFLDLSSCYYSTQKLTSKDAKYYLDPKNGYRLDEEINKLRKKLSGDNQTELKKIFVIEDNKFTDGKINDDEFKKYLLRWKNEFPDAKQNGNKIKTSDKFPIKVINEKLTAGVVIKDIGIFGNFYGIQSVRSKDNKKFNNEELKIDFFFDKEKTKIHKSIFLDFFNSDNAKGLSDVLD